MLSHALTIVANEFESHLVEAYGAPPNTSLVRLGNLAEGIGANANNSGSVPRDVLAISMVNVKEEKTLRNVSGQIRNDATLRVVHEHPPVFLNFLILVTATHSSYSNALLMLSRAVRFFQARRSFDQDSVAPASLTTNAPPNPLDQLETFRLIFDLYSPNMEEVNHLWGTLGGKQYPFILYTLRMLELKFKAVLEERGMITEIVQDFRHKDPAA